MRIFILMPTTSIYIILGLGIIVFLASRVFSSSTDVNEPGPDLTKDKDKK
jgi:hypothetical protein